MTVLYTFTGGVDGADPIYFGTGPGDVRDKEGNLYGVGIRGGMSASAHRRYVLLIGLTSKREMRLVLDDEAKRVKTPKGGVATD